MVHSGGRSRQIIGWWTQQTKGATLNLSTEVENPGYLFMLGALRRSEAGRVAADAVREVESHIREACRPSRCRRAPALGGCSTRGHRTGWRACPQNWRRTGGVERATVATARAEFPRR
jgi:hypothetical protein